MTSAVRNQKLILSKNFNVSFKLQKWQMLLHASLQLPKESVKKEEAKCTRQSAKHKQKYIKASYKKSRQKK
jgi:hypothetical protein